MCNEEDVRLEDIGNDSGTYWVLARPRRHLKQVGKVEKESWSRCGYSLFF